MVELGIRFHYELLDEFEKRMALATKATAPRDRLRKEYIKNKVYYDELVLLRPLTVNEIGYVMVEQK